MRILRGFPLPERNLRAAIAGNLDMLVPLLAMNGTTIDLEVNVVILDLHP